MCYTLSARILKYYFLQLDILGIDTKSTKINISKNIQLWLY